ncbi:MAG: DNA repair exonuclease [Candidatus Lokiarchaeota archaeon]|nr:DNA repair exonuclease [Candidatus Lokiarchaeota archaeon]
MMKILHTSDLHLKNNYDERWYTLINLLEIGERENIDLFVISGDLFDQNYNAECLRPECRDIFSDNNFEIILIPGNHDKDCFADGYVFGNDVKVIREFGNPLVYEDIAVWGLPFEFITSQEVFSMLYSKKEEFIKFQTNILLFHGDLIDAMYLGSQSAGEEGDRQYMPVKLSFFRDLDIQYVLGGHIHSNFGVWEIDTEKYFVYSGSPISITRKETGNRKVNLFECGSRPSEYNLSTLYYENLRITLDPLKKLDPISIIKDSLEKYPDYARVLLNVDGFINSGKIGFTEEELTNEINELFESVCEEINIKFQDIKSILQDDLFIKFSEKLKIKEIDEDEMKKITDIVIKALMKILI